MSSRPTAMAEHFRFVFQWPEILQPWKYNWVNFDFFRFGFEYDKIMGFFTLEFALLGIGFGFRRQLVATETSQELARQSRLLSHGMLETEEIGTTPGGIKIMASQGFLEQFGHILDAHAAQQAKKDVEPEGK